MQTRAHLLTEQVNPNSANLDQLSSLEIVELFNQEDAKTISAIAAVKEKLAMAIDRTADSLRQGGRLLYAP
jgi:N-acetylmuramic acid 6-phosphate etherase